MNHLTDCQVFNNISAFFPRGGGLKLLTFIEIPETELINNGNDNFQFFREN